jgi:hypothetical protein
MKSGSRKGAMLIASAASLAVSGSIFLLHRSRPGLPGDFSAVACLGFWLGMMIAVAILIQRRAGRWGPE